MSSEAKLLSDSRGNSEELWGQEAEPEALKVAPMAPERESGKIRGAKSPN